MINFNRVAVNLIILVLFFFMTLVYVFFLQELNAYIGYLKIDFNLDYFLWLLLGLVISIPLLPYRFLLPSDFYLFFHVFLIIIPFVFLGFSGSSEVTWTLILFYLLLVLPAFAVKFTRNINFIPLSMKGVISRDFAFWFIAFVAFFLIFIAFLNSPASSGFDLSTSYLRRIEGRDSYPAGSFLAYSNSIVMNGLLPLIAFWAGIKKSKLFLLIPILGWLSFYYLIGVKAPAFFVVLAYYIGLAFFSNPGFKRKLVYYILLFVLFLASISLVEIVFFEYSYLADYLLRRVFTVPPFLMSIYSNFIYYHHGGEWSMLTGLVDKSPVSFIVGEDFMGLQGLNANTNTYLVAFTSGGIFNYLFVCSIVVFVFNILDWQYRKRGNVNMIYCGLIMALLLVEQYVLTIILSSGFLFVLLISLLIKADDVKNT